MSVRIRQRASGYSVDQFDVRLHRQRTEGEDVFTEIEFPRMGTIEVLVDHAWIPLDDLTKAHELVEGVRAGL